MKPQTNKVKPVVNEMFLEYVMCIYVNIVFLYNSVQSSDSIMSYIPPTTIGDYDVQKAFREITDLYLGKPDSWGPQWVWQPTMTLMLKKNLNYQVARKKRAGI